MQPTIIDDMNANDDAPNSMKAADWFEAAMWAVNAYPKYKDDLSATNPEEFREYLRDNGLPYELGSKITETIFGRDCLDGRNA